MVGECVCVGGGGGDRGRDLEWRAGSTVVMFTSG